MSSKGPIGGASGGRGGASSSPIGRAKTPDANGNGNAKSPDKRVTMACIPACNGNASDAGGDSTVDKVKNSSSPNKPMTPRALPEGWLAMIHPDTGETVYVNKDLRKVQKNFPSSTTSSKKSNRIACPNRAETPDRRLKTPDVNGNGNAKSPVKRAIIAPASAGNGIVSDAGDKDCRSNKASSPSSPRALPEGWVEKIHPDTGDVVYVNKDLRLAQKGFPSSASNGVGAAMDTSRLSSRTSSTNNYNSSRGGSAETPDKKRRDPKTSMGDQLSTKSYNENAAPVGLNGGLPTTGDTSSQPRSLVKAKSGVETEIKTGEELQYRANDMVKSHEKRVKELVGRLITGTSDIIKGDGAATRSETAVENISGDTNRADFADDFDEERFIELVKLFRSSGVKGYSGDVKLDYLNELIVLAAIESNRPRMLAVKFDLLPTILNLLMDSNPRIAAHACKLSCMLSLDSTSKRVLFSKAARFMPGIVSIAFKTQPGMLQARIFAGVAISNLTEDPSINTSILVDYDGLNIIGLVVDLLSAENEQLVTIGSNILKNLASCNSNLEKLASDKDVLAAIKSVLGSNNERARKYIMRVLVDMSLDLRNKSVFLNADLVATLLQLIARDSIEDIGVYSIISNLSPLPEVDKRLPIFEIVRATVLSLQNGDISISCQLTIYQLLLNFSATADEFSKVFFCSDELGLLSLLMNTLKTFPHPDLVANACAIILNCASVYDVRRQLVSKTITFEVGLVDCLVNLLKKKSVGKIPLISVFILLKLTNIHENEDVFMLSYSEISIILSILADLLVDSRDEELRSAICNLFLNLSEWNATYIPKAFVDRNIISTLLYVMRSYSTDPASWLDLNIPGCILSVLMYLARHRPVIDCLKYLRAEADIAPLLEYKGVEVIKAILIMCLLLGNDEMKQEKHDVIATEHAIDKLKTLIHSPTKNPAKEVVSAMKIIDTPLLSKCPKAIKILLSTLQNSYSMFARESIDEKNVSIKLARINEIFPAVVLMRAVLFVFTNSTHGKMPEVYSFTPRLLQLLQLVLKRAQADNPLFGFGLEALETALDALTHLTFAFDSKNKPLDPSTGVHLFVNEDYDIISILEGFIQLNKPNLSLSTSYKRLCLQLLRKYAPVKFQDSSYFLFYLAIPPPAKEKPLTSPSDSERGNHIMISYCMESSSRDRVLYLSRHLSKLGCDVWRSDTGSHRAPPLALLDFSDAPLSSATNQSQVAILCVSPEYKLSAQCRLEANQLFKLAKKGRIKLAIVILLDVDSSPEFMYGWLGALVGNALNPCFSLSDMEQVAATAAAILDAVDMEKRSEVPEMTLESAIAMSFGINSSVNMGNMSATHSHSPRPQDESSPASWKKLASVASSAFSSPSARPGNEGSPLSSKMASNSSASTPLLYPNHHLKMYGQAVVAMGGLDKKKKVLGLAVDPDLQLPAIPNTQGALEMAWCMLHDRARLQDPKKMETTLFDIGVLEIAELELLDSETVELILEHFKPVQRAKFMKLIKHVLNKTAPVSVPAASAKDIAIKYFGDNDANDRTRQDRAYQDRTFQDGSFQDGSLQDVRHSSETSADMNGFDIRNLDTEDPLAMLNDTPHLGLYRTAQLRPAKPRNEPPSSPFQGGLGKRLSSKPPTPIASVPGTPYSIGSFSNGYDQIPGSAGSMRFG